VALAYELEKRGLRVTRQQAIPVVYEAVRIDTGFYADLVVENQVIVEIKAVEAVAPVHKKQLLTYWKLDRQAPEAAHQLQRYPDQSWHHSHRQRA
jgi:GxxExxY protein